MSFIKRVELEVNNLIYFLKTKFDDANHDDANHFDAVPAELIIRIFSLSGNTRLERICKRFYEISFSQLIQNQSLHNQVRIAFRNLLAGNSEQLERAAAGLAAAADDCPISEEGVQGIGRVVELNLFYHSKLQVYHNELQAFYDAVIERMTQLNLIGDKLFIYANAANSIFKGYFRERKVINVLHNTSPSILNLKVEKTFQAFNEKLFKKAIADFADQPLTQITIESFKQQAALLGMFFRQISHVDIEAELRQAIRYKHSIAAIDAMRTALENSAIAQVAKTPSFYSELSLEVNRDNKYARSEALHQIID